MLVPVSISRSWSLISVSGKTATMSSTFIATFPDGSQKTLNDVYKKDVRFLEGETVGVYYEEFLSKETCCLYFRDWAKMPVFGKREKDYHKLGLLIPACVSEAV